MKKILFISLVLLFITSLSYGGFKQSTHFMNANDSPRVWEEPSPYKSTSNFTSTFDLTADVYTNYPGGQSGNYVYAESAVYWPTTSITVADTFARAGDNGKLEQHVFKYYSGYVCQFYVYVWMELPSGYYGSGNAYISW